MTRAPAPDGDSGPPAPPADNPEPPLARLRLLARQAAAAGDHAAAGQWLALAMTAGRASVDDLNFRAFCAISAGDYAAAEGCLLPVLAACPELAGAWRNLFGAYWSLGRFEDAGRVVEHWLARAPGQPWARYMRAFLALRQGDFAGAAADFRARLAIPGWGRQFPDIPDWQGQDLGGAALLAIGEGGYGDLFQFVRFLPGLVAAGLDVRFLAPADLRWLFDGQPRFGRIPPPDTAFTAAAQVSLFDLPFLTGARPDHLPTGRYLSAPATERDAWRARLATMPAGPRSGRPLSGGSLSGGSLSGPPRIGLVWRAGGEADRAIPLAPLAGLIARLPVRAVALQADCTPAERACLAGAEILLPADLDRGPDRFRDSAAILAGLDLLIAADTGMAHLAGALGCPVWLMLKCHPDWRWLADRDDSPWYPGMRLFRQHRPGDWRGALADLERALAIFGNAAI